MPGRGLGLTSEREPPRFLARDRLRAAFTLQEALQVFGCGPVPRVTPLLDPTPMLILYFIESFFDELFLRLGLPEVEMVREARSIEIGRGIVGLAPRFAGPMILGPIGYHPLATHAAAHLRQRQ
jgi:hypothetical protein